jgi:hypothetical protein
MQEEMIREIEQADQYVVSVVRMIPGWSDRIRSANLYLGK